jgi:hypothetical protein
MKRLKTGGIGVIAISEYQTCGGSKRTANQKLERRVLMKGKEIPFHTYPLPQTEEVGARLNDMYGDMSGTGARLQCLAPT